jgi:tetratricopeptide (TPR) repeat protein
MSPAARMALNQGLAAAEAHQYDVALSDFKNAFAADQTDPELWFDLGLASSKLPGRELDAITYFEAYLRRVPGAPNRRAILNTINQLEAVVQGKLVAIIGEMQKIWPSTIDKNSSFGTCGGQAYIRIIATAYAKVGLWQKAKELYQSAINYSPQANESCNFVGGSEGAFAKALAESGDVEGAARHMQRYLDWLSTQNGDQTYNQARTGFALLRSYGNWGALPQAKAEFEALEKNLPLPSKTDYADTGMTDFSHWGNTVCLAWHANDMAMMRNLLQWEAKLTGPDAASGSGIAGQLHTVVEIASIEQMMGDHVDALATIGMLPLPANGYLVTSWKQWAAAHAHRLSAATRDISLYVTLPGFYPFPTTNPLKGDADPGAIYCAPKSVPPPHIYENMGDADLSVDVHKDCAFNHLKQCLVVVAKEADYRQSLQPDQRGVGLLTQFYTYGRIVGYVAGRLNALKQIQQALLQSN